MGRQKKVTAATKKHLSKKRKRAERKARKSDKS